MMSTVPHLPDSPTADEAASGPAATFFPTETPVDCPPPTDSVLWADRRLADRLPPLPAARVEARRPGAGGGPDFVEELLDVSATGARVRLCLPVRPGERFDVTFWGPGGSWCGRSLAVVRWAVATGPATGFAGIQFTRPLPARQLHELADEN